MKTPENISLTILKISLFLLLFYLAGIGGPVPELPYREAGLSERQAAAHLLNRFGYGATSEDIESVLQTGLEQWLTRQLAGNYPDPEIAPYLPHLTYLNLPDEEVIETYPTRGQILRRAVADGFIDSDARQTMTQEELQQKLRPYARENGWRPVRELLGQMMTHKLVRAVYSSNQLQEVLTDFWFNHFNVSTTDNQARVMIPLYERDAIRPNVLGNFRTMLGAVARHPAMLLYLDNAQSSAAANTKTTMDYELDRLRNEGSRMVRRRIDRALERREKERQAMMANDSGNRRQRPGINENYARELLELHTLGVDGGYTQEDVIAVARAFSGWTIIRPGNQQERIEKRIREGKAVGVVREGFFLFRADQHDAGEKIILGNTFPAGGGIDDGEQVLDLLAAHPATAQHIARKLAVRFVSDDPPQSLVDTLAKVFLQTRGDLKQMIITIAQSPAFWSSETIRAKIKSPFEVTASALRVIDAEIRRPRQLIEWVSRMGQPLYAYQAPTGYPDIATAWVNTGALLNRMNFGMSLATGDIRGTRFDLAALNGYREPASLEDALSVYAAILLPERNLTETIEALLPVIHAPDFAERVSNAVDANNTSPPDIDADFMALDNTSPEMDSNQQPLQLTHVVGVILGSPEFQRK